MEPKLSDFAWRQRVEVFENKAWRPGTVEQAYRSDHVCRVAVDGQPGLLMVRKARYIRPLVEERTR